MRGSSKQTFVPNLLTPAFQKRFFDQGGGPGFVKSLVTTGPQGSVCAVQPASLAGTVGGVPTVRPLGRAGQ